MTSDNDPLDQPEPDGMTLVMPFIVCQSNGGPYDDDAFTAGYHAGLIDRSLAVASVAEADRAKFMVRTALVPQLELLGMLRGFPVITMQESDFPEWTSVTFEVDPETP